MHPSRGSEYPDHRGMAKTEIPAQVNFTTRSGTNDFHGNAYWHNRNSKLSANQWFSNKTGTPKPFLNLNQIGGSLGGPIIKNKLLFYTNYEAYRRRAESLANSVILTQDARQGVFTYRDQRTNRAQKVNVLRATGTPVDPGVADLMESVPDGDNINNFDVGDSDRTLLRNTAGYRFNISAVRGKSRHRTVSLDRSMSYGLFCPGTI